MRLIVRSAVSARKKSLKQKPSSPRSCVRAQLPGIAPWARWGVTRADVCVHLERETGVVAVVVVIALQQSCGLTLTRRHPLSSVR